MPTDSTSPLPLSQLSLRQRERGLVLGGVEAGKSTLADLLGRDFVQRYSDAGGRRLLLDSKPRYRASWRLSGRRARGLYRRWGHGPVIADSVLCDEPQDLERAFAMGSTVIVQGESERDIPRLVACCAEFLRSSRASRPQLLQIDELLDFFHGNGAPRGGDDAVTRSVRAGRERGTGCLFCSQRTRGIPSQVMSELSRLYLFRMDFAGDAKRIQEMGAPPTMRPPRRAREFRYWTKAKYDRVWGPYTLQLA